jgi:hypothetical protein
MKKTLAEKLTIAWRSSVTINDEIAALRQVVEVHFNYYRLPKEFADLIWDWTGSHSDNVSFSEFELLADTLVKLIPEVEYEEIRYG